MRIEKIVDEWTCWRVEHLINFEYESYKEIIECVVSLTGWDDYDYDTYDHDYENNYNILEVWNDDNPEDMVTIYIIDEEEEEDEEEYRLLENLEYGEEYRFGYDEEEEYDYDDEEEED